MNLTSEDNSWKSALSSICGNKIDNFEEAIAREIVVRYRAFTYGKKANSITLFEEFTKFCISVVETHIAYNLLLAYKENKDYDEYLPGFIFTIAGIGNLDYLKEFKEELADQAIPYEFFLTNNESQELLRKRLKRLEELGATFESFTFIPSQHSARQLKSFLERGDKSVEEVIDDIEDFEEIFAVDGKCYVSNQFKDLILTQNLFCYNIGLQLALSHKFQSKNLVIPTTPFKTFNIIVAIKMGQKIKEHSIDLMDKGTISKELGWLRVNKRDLKGLCLKFLTEEYPNTIF